MKLHTLKLSNGRKYRVAVSKRRHAPLGETTLFNEVVINHLILKRPHLLDYVVTHEFAHKRQWYGFVIAGLSTFMYLASLVTLILGVMGLAFTGAADTGWPQMLNWRWTAPTFAILAMLSSWFVEYIADAESINLLGRDRVLLAFEEGRRLLKPGVVCQTLALFSRLPDRLTILLYTRLHTPRLNRPEPIQPYTRTSKRGTLTPSPFPASGTSDIAIV
jgi:hypothetical protein